MSASIYVLQDGFGRVKLGISRTGRRDFPHPVTLESQSLARE